MSTSELRDVLADIIDLLGQTGHEDRARWLAERLALLSDATATVDAQEYARTELHGVVLGMGGLMDLVPRPESSSRWTASVARQQLDELADRLYALTK